MRRFVAPLTALVVVLGGCGTQPIAQPDAHLVVAPPVGAATQIPQPVRAVPLPPPPESRPMDLRYSVVVANQSVRDVLLAIARDTSINFDIHPGVEGAITLNAIDQTLPQILNRIQKQVDMRWEHEGQTISVMPDAPYLKSYRVDYVNMSRDVTGTIGVQSQVVGPGSSSSGGSGGSSSGYSGSSSSQNSSLMKVELTQKNRFWETLEKNIKDMLRETDKQLPEGSTETFVQGRATGQPARAVRRTPSNAATVTGAAGTVASVTAEAPNPQTAEYTESRLTFREAASVIVNPETGILTVRATGRQHERVGEFITQVTGSARRQVMIEATVVEVLLSDQYQSGVDWSSLALDGLGYSFRQSLTTTNLAAPNPFFSATYNNPNAPLGGSISGTVKLLDTFGKTRVLSSPKIMALNNQTAILKVVDNRVYFTITAQVTPGNTNANAIVVYTSTQNVVPVGFVMNVTPQISENDVVVLNVRPSISRIIGFVNDPNPDLARANVQSRIPEIQSREFESVLRVASGQTAILGGLMQDSFEGNRTGVPIVSRIPSSATPSRTATTPRRRASS
jgi:general secretion pathway protein D